MRSREKRFARFIDEHGCTVELEGHIEVIDSRTGELVPAMQVRPEVTVVLPRKLRLYKQDVVAARLESCWKAAKKAGVA